MTGTLIFLYGPPGSGKSTLGRLLARDLALPFIDLDGEIEAHKGLNIAEIFTQAGEACFRAIEKNVLIKILESCKEGVVALGGGTLLDLKNRLLVESAGRVLCLAAPLERLLERVKAEAGSRPLINGDVGARLRSLLAERSSHYASFPDQLYVDGGGPEEIAWKAQVHLGAFYVRGMGEGYVVRVQPGGLSEIGVIFEANRFAGEGKRVVVVSDSNIFPIYGERVCRALRGSGYDPYPITFPAGEQYKTLESVCKLWEAFLHSGLERADTVVAVGGGVTGDLAGFAAAAYMRGISWVNLPTSLLAMVDASLGGKTGVDLPQGKNLVGAFHPPRRVVIDPLALETLPEREWRSGMAEVVKAGVIGDQELFALCARGWETIRPRMEEVIRRAIALKISLIQADPYEKGRRAVLNLGHTVGHALEWASDFRLSHGEAVAIGMVVEARLAERLGLAQAGLAGHIEQVLRGLGLPTRVPYGMEPGRVLQDMAVDKKKASGELYFALPEAIGRARSGVRVDGERLEMLRALLGEK